MLGWRMEQRWGSMREGSLLSGAQLAPGSLMSGQAMVLPRSVRLGNVAWWAREFAGASGLQETSAALPAFLSCQPSGWIQTASLGILHQGPPFGRLACGCYALEPGQWGQRLVRGPMAPKGVRGQQLLKG